MKYFKKIAAVMMAFLLGLTGVTTAKADGATSISISPTSKILALEADTVYEDTLKVVNNGEESFDFEVSAKPYAYVYSEEAQAYKLSHEVETAYTQMSRWLTFEDAEGNWAETAILTAEPGGVVDVNYRVTTPVSIPAGGQYAIVRIQILTNEAATDGVRINLAPSMPIYGRSDGETIVSWELSDLEISDTIVTARAIGDISGVETTEHKINGTARLKNTGNVDFTQRCTLKVTGITGRVYYNNTSACGQSSIIPEAEIVLTDVWKETPYFGLFNVEWTVEAVEEVQTISKTILLLPEPIIILMILLLTIVIVWIIILVRKRRERRSRFMV